MARTAGYPFGDETAVKTGYHTLLYTLSGREWTHLDE